MTGWKETPIDFDWRNGQLHFTLDEPGELDGILVEFTGERANTN